MLTNKLERNLWGTFSVIGIVVIVYRFIAWMNERTEAYNLFIAIMIYALCFKFFYSSYKTVKREDKKRSGD